MSLPIFYIPDYKENQQLVTLDEDASRHIVQVLRMRKGESLQLTDGAGHLLLADVEDDHKKHCSVSIREVQYHDRPARRVSIGISLLKNANRFEWFLEKATELGVASIIPLLCERTEKEKFRYDRLHGITVSAMIQSQQSWLPVLHQPVAYELLFRQEEIAAASVKLIAHCRQDDKRDLASVDFGNEPVMLIGPEGDFTEKEIELALTSKFIPVALGNTRLRTETAGITAASLLCLV